MRALLRRRNAVAFALAGLLAGAWTFTSAVAQPAAKPVGRPAPKVAMPAPPAAPQGGAWAGKGKADDERCLECHGAGPEAKFAKLAGQQSAYLLKQLEDFRSGTRKHEVMQMTVRRLAPADRALYTQGDAAHGVVPCISCHGDDGKGGVVGGPLMPVIAGQAPHYLEQQLLDWRHGFRKNSVDGVMSRATSLPPGAPPPTILIYSATNLPVLQLGISSDKLSVHELDEQVYSNLRTRLLRVPGVRVTAPFGGRSRKVTVDIDGPALLARGLTAVDVVNALSVQNLTLPTDEERRCVDARHHRQRQGAAALGAATAA